MRTLADNSVDSVVTDPPYGWRFMGKAWDGADIEKMAAKAKGPAPRLSSDGVMRQPREKPAEAAGKYDTSLTGNQAFQVFTEQWAKEAFRVLKPGGHMLVFCGPRTYHRMASGVEDAGFEIRDQLQWLFGSGFPKSLDVSKAIDKAAGVKNVVGLSHDKHYSENGVTSGASVGGVQGGHNYRSQYEITAPATDAAKQWEGWGTALKPANEPIVLARKPLEKGLTVAENVQKWGTGAINIDGCRIAGIKPEMIRTQTVTAANAMSGASTGSTSTGQISTEGRFPANVMFDADASNMLDEQAGQEVSRFFYCAKASTSERNAGLEEMPAKSAAEMVERVDGSAGMNSPRAGAGRTGGGKNFHPTVKPVKLMEYLCRLVTPKGGIVLDPFMGSGTTGIAAKKLGLRFTGIELSSEYFNIASARINSFLLERQIEIDS